MLPLEQMSYKAIDHTRMNKDSFTFMEELKGDRTEKMCGEKFYVYNISIYISNIVFFYKF